MSVPTRQAPARTAEPAPAPAARTRRRVPAWAVGVAAVTAVAVLPLLNISLPGVLPGPTYTPGSLHLMTLSLIFAALALSYHLLYGVAGMLSFGHALYFAAGAYGLGIVLSRTDLPLLTAAAVVLAGTVVLAHVVGAISLRVSGVSFAMVTLAFAQAGNVLVRRNTGGVTGGEEGVAPRTDNVPDALVGVVNTRNMFWVALAALVAVYVVVTWTQRSRAGHVVEATRENEMRVRVIGQQPFLIRLLTFVIAAALASVVGMVYLLLQSQAVPAITSADFTITVLVMVVLGGVGSRWGAIVGAVVYTLLDQRLSAFASSDVVASLPPVLHVPLSEPLFILGTLFILVVLFMPGGIAGAAERLAGRPARARASAEKDRAARESAERRRLEELA
ncbi:branched-chain amino acid ABC transporter permease [Georgenia muralis]|uniref:Amino acid/amide ABC transporter membrane protein 2 (HAAT family) n=1 Tax=Georgenia muralis TaxID=154117 RepID=A0A3N4Z7M8_9MICO|nr:branched-chain amino acid ABC transporter permease [Georgenia muralis]RPF27200.1 amino acid/amide ABC transporter membrane protein 2 (HAAT family) [Georgenia muralis]